MIALKDTPEGVIIPVRVTPGASRDRILGEHAGALKLSVSASPEKGKANRAVCRLLAKTLGIAKSNVRIVSGETSRDKRVLVRGPDKDVIAGKLISSPLGGQGEG